MVKGATHRGHLRAFAMLVLLVPKPPQPKEAECRGGLCAKRH
jgi:hypothetical protein